MAELWRVLSLRSSTVSSHQFNVESGDPSRRESKVANSMRKGCCCDP